MSLGQRSARDARLGECYFVQRHRTEPIRPQCAALHLHGARPAVRLRSNEIANLSSLTPRQALPAVASKLAAMCCKSAISIWIQLVAFAGLFHMLEHNQPERTARSADEGPTAPPETEAMAHPARLLDETLHDMYAEPPLTRRLVAAFRHEQRQSNLTIPIPWAGMVDWRVEPFEEPVDLVRTDRRPLLPVPKDADIWVDFEDGADYLRLPSADLLRAAVDAGLLQPDGRNGPDGDLLFRVSTLDAYAAHCAAGQGPQASNDDSHLKPRAKSQRRAAKAPAAAFQPDQVWYTTVQSAAFLQLGNASTIRGLVSRGDLKPDGKSGKTMVFSRETLDAYVKRGQHGNRPNKIEENQAPGRVQDAGRATVGAGRGTATERQGGDASSLAAGGRQRRGRGAGRVGPADGDQKPAVDPYAPPADFVYDRGRLR